MDATASLPLVSPAILRNWVEALGPEFYKRFAHDHAVPLILGVGAAFLTESTPEEVAERVRRYVTVGSRGDRFALYLCNLGASTPPQNLAAAVEAAHDCSRR